MQQPTRATRPTEPTVQAATERSVVAVLLNDNHAIVPVMGVLDGPEMFTDPECRRAYTAMLALLKENVPPNVYTVAERSGLALETLQGLARNWNTKASREVLYSCDNIAKWYRRATLERALGDAQDMLAANPDDLSAYATQVMQMVALATEGRAQRDPTIGAVTQRLDAEIEAAKYGLVGFETGLEWLDGKTGGLQKAQVWVVAAPYKGRKTTLARNLILKPLRDGASVDWFALEGTQVGAAAALEAMLATDRLLKWGRQQEAYLSEMFVLRGLRTQAQQEALHEARAELNCFNLRIYDGRDKINSAERISTLVKRDQLVNGTAIFLIDYLQRLGTGKLYDRMEANANVLQNLIQENGLTGILLSQLSEDAIRAYDDDTYSPGTKGGGDVPAAADFLIMTRYKSEAPDRLGVALKLARFALPGKCEYGINPQSGFVFQQLNQGD